MKYVELRRRTILADYSPDSEEWRGGPVMFFWTTAGALVVLVGGLPLLVLWLLPGVPPPGPFG